MATKKTSTTKASGKSAPEVKPKAEAVKPKAEVVKPKAEAVKPKAEAVKPKAEVVKPNAAAATEGGGKEATSAALTVGAKAPDFKLAADDGSTVSLADLAGKNVVLYFYPRDNTPGCTREACAFQENLGAITERGAVVLGVSRDSAKTHAGFKTKYGLGFPLLADTDTSVHKAYGAWGKKMMYGKESIGPIRSTVIIDKKGKIAKLYPSVKVDSHVGEVLAALDSMRA